MKINLDEPSTYKTLKGKFSDKDAIDGSVPIEAVYGMHCCKISDENEILTKGLLPLQLDQRINYVMRLLKNEGLSELACNYFSSTVINNYSSFDLSCRENMIWFCLNRSLIFNQNGCERFFQYFGGEVIVCQTRAVAAIFSRRSTEA